MKFISSVFITALLGLTACQQGGPVDPLKAEFQMNAGQAVQNYSNSISRAIGSNPTQSSVRGALGSWDPWCGTVYGGGPPTQNNIGNDSARCQELMNQLPRTAQYFHLRLGTLARCLNVANSYRNPVFAFGNQRLDSSAQYGWGYDLNYARPTSYSGFSQQDYNSWSPYAQNGFYPPEVPNYQVPGFGW